MRKALLPGILLTLLALGTTASAMPAFAAPDFAPFVMHENYWTAAMVHFADGRVQAGNSTYEIRYTGRDHWQVTQLSHSFEPKRSGTTWTFNGVTLTKYDALRGVTRTLPRPYAVDNWIQPGQLEALSRRIGATVRDDPTTDQREIVWNVVTPSGAVSRTRVVFDRATRLPLLVEDWDGGTLVRRITFTLVPG